MRKVEIRNEIKSKRNVLTQEEINKKSEIIINKLIVTSEYKKAKVIFVYVSFGSEVKTHEFIKLALKQGKRIGIPVTDIKNKIMICSEIKNFDKELEKKAFGILEPKEEYIREILIDTIDLLIVPCVAFDKRCFRIGYGAGFYDRFLKNLNKDIFTIGLAYEFQLIEKVPVAEHDIAVRKILTESNEYYRY